MGDSIKYFIRWKLGSTDPSVHQYWNPQKIAIEETATQDKKDSKVQLEKDLGDVVHEEVDEKDKAEKSKDTVRYSIFF